jgi:hypothetical protein
MRCAAWGRAGASLVSLLYGCGGVSTHSGNQAPSSGNEAGAGAAGTDDAAGLGGALQATATGGHGGSAVGAEAGQASEPRPLIRSATRYCESSLECFGFECVAPAQQPPVCVVPCASDEDCQADEACLGAATLEKSCFPRCDSPADCANAFDCFDFDESSGLVCFPAPWTNGWR